MLNGRSVRPEAGKAVAKMSRSKDDTIFLKIKTEYKEIKSGSKQK